MRKIGDFVLGYLVFGLVVGVVALGFWGAQLSYAVRRGQTRVQFESLGD